MVEPQKENEGAEVQPVLRLFIFLILMISVIARMPESLYTPALPTIGSDLEMSKSVLSSTVTFYMFSFALGSLFAGPISDSIGRRPVLLFGMTFIGLGCILCALAPGPCTFIVARIVQAVGACCIPVVCRIAIREKIHDQVKLVSLLGWIALISGIVPILSPVLGGLIVQYSGWRPIFLLPGWLAFFSLLLLIPFYLETLPPKKRIPLHWKHHLHSLRCLLSDRYFSILLFPSLVTFMIQGAYLTLSPFILLQQFGCSPSFYGWTNLLIVFSMVTGRFFASRILIYGGQSKGFILGGMILFLGSLLLLISAWSTPSLTMVLSFFAVICLGMGIILPLGNLSLMTRFQHLGGAASSLYTFMTIAAAGVGAALAGVLMFWNINELVGMAALSVALAGLNILALFLFNYDSTPGTTS